MRRYTSVRPLNNKSLLSTWQLQTDYTLIHIASFPSTIILDNNVRTKLINRQHFLRRPHSNMYIQITNFLVNTIGFFIAIAIVAYTYFKWSFQYWKRKGVQFSSPSIPFGNEDSPFRENKRTFGILTRDIYNELKGKGAKFGGMYSYTVPLFLTIDPEIVRNVLAKDFRCDFINSYLIVFVILFHNNELHWTCDCVKISEIDLTALKYLQIFSKKKRNYM